MKCKELYNKITSLRRNGKLVILNSVLLGKRQKNKMFLTEDLVGEGLDIEQPQKIYPCQWQGWHSPKKWFVPYCQSFRH